MFEEANTATNLGAMIFFISMFNKVFRLRYQVVTQQTYRTSKPSTTAASYFLKFRLYDVTWVVQTFVSICVKD